MRPSSGRLAVALAAVVTLAGLSASEPAAAHSGNKAQLFVASVEFEPAGGGWMVLAEIRDADSGQLEPGYDVSLAGRSTASSLPPTPLTDPESDGVYQAEVPLPDGQWSVTVEAKPFATGKEALPATRTWDVALRAGAPIRVGQQAAAPSAPEPDAASEAAADQGAGGGDSGGGGAGVVIAAAAAVAVAAGFVLLRRRGFRPGNPTR